MAHISTKDQEYLRKLFSGMENEVNLIFFTQEFECEYCQMTHELLEELKELSDKISLEVYDLVKDEDKAKQYGIEEIPAVVVKNQKDYGIRFVGIPAGYEFSSVIEDIIDVSKGTTSLSVETKQALAKIDKPVHIQVFITPTCPYCPQAVRMAHMMALENDMIRGDMVEAIEFPHLANHYNVGAVPKVIINDMVEFEGAIGEKQYLEQVLRAVSKTA